MKRCETVEELLKEIENGKKNQSGILTGFNLLSDVVCSRWC